jgi:hypothetical protein
MSKAIKFKQDVVCDSCGQYGAFDFGDEFLCGDCYAQRGSCCLEFGEHDLWKDKKEHLDSEDQKNKG